MFILMFIVLILGIIALPLYFISKWAFGKLNIGAGKNRKYFALIPTLLLTPVVIGGLGILFFFFLNFSDSNGYFSEYSWKNKPSKRYTMSQDLITTGILIGNTREEVVEKLGDDYYRYDENTIGYDLRKWTWQVMKEPEILKIRFWNGRVVDVTQPNLSLKKDEYDEIEVQEICIEEFDENSL